MKTTITSEELKKALLYVSPAAGAKTTANPESTLVYIHIVPEKQKALFQVQSSYISSRLVIEIEACESEEHLKCLVDFAQLHTYVKNSKDAESFELDFEDDDVLAVNIGEKLIGKLVTTPLDSYELQNFKSSEDICTISTELLQDSINASCQFANTKEDTEDFIQILGEDQKLTLFTVNNEVLAEFNANLGDLEEDFDISVKASSLKKLKGFLTDTVTLQSSEDGYFIILKEQRGARAIVTYVDPPSTIQEFREDIEQPDETFEIGWSVGEMSDSIKNIGCSSKDGYLLFSLKDSDNMNLRTESNRNTMTKVMLPITSLGYDEDKLSSERFRTSISLLRKLGTLNKSSGRVNVKFCMDEDDIDDPHVKTMTSTGLVDNINYSITFGVLDI